VSRDSTKKEGCGQQTSIDRFHVPSLDVLISRDSSRIETIVTRLLSRAVSALSPFALLEAIFPSRHIAFAVWGRLLRLPMIRKPSLNAGEFKRLKLNRYNLNQMPIFQI
jgi:hypothetical protein